MINNLDWYFESDSLDDLSLIKSSFKNEFLQKEKIFDRFDDMKNIASNRLENWLEEDDEDISQNSDFKSNSFYNENISTRSFIDKKKMTLGYEE